MAKSIPQSAFDIPSCYRPQPPPMRALPNNLDRWFSRDTLALVRKVPCPVVVTDLLYFRDGSSARMHEPGGRSYTSFLRIESGEPAAYQCTCPHRQSATDLCRHLALLFAQSVELDENGAFLRLRSERFESSLWFVVAKGMQTGLDGARLEHLFDREGDARIAQSAVAGDVRFELRLESPEERELTLAFSAWPAECRPSEIPVEASRDGRETRLMKETRTTQEAALEKRGVAPTARQLWESSFWFRVSRSLFDLLGDSTEGTTLASVDGTFALRHETADVSLVFKLTADAMAALLQHADAAMILARSGFRREEGAAHPSLRIALTPTGGLRFVPAILARGQVFDRSGLDASSFGRWFHFPEASLFATLADAPRLFPEKPAQAQAVLSFGGAWVPSASGISLERETTIPHDEVFAFLRRHREAIAAHPVELVDPALREARPADVDDAMDVEVLSAADGEYELAVRWSVEGATIALADVVAARKKKQHVIMVGAKWVAAASPAFAWIDDLPKERFSGSKQKSVRVRPIEWLRIRSAVSTLRVTGDPTSAQALEDLASLRAGGEAPDASALGIDLYSYQQTGFKWLWFLDRQSFGGLLCDDMGLGKTHQAMALVRAITAEDPLARILVVCPTSVLDHWKTKLGEYMPDLQVESYTGGVPGGARIVLASYGIARNHAAALARTHWDLLVLDEIQTIKNRTTATHQALAMLPRRIALGLTGTPVENHVGELRTLLDFVQPGYLPGEASFERHFAIPIERDLPGARDRLARLIDPFVLRRTKAQVLTELPEKIVDVRHCELTDEQKALYREVLAGRGKSVADDLASGRRLSYLHVFAVLNYLKQVCNHPALFHDGPDPDRFSSGKWELFRELLGESLDSGLKVVVFSQYVGMLRLIETHLERSGIDFATIKGDTKDRGAMTRRFRDDPDCRVFTASLRAGGVGIDLTPASVVIHYDRWWNQAREDQATDRVHRLGQNRGVQVIKLITKGTLEEKIDAMIARKGELASDLVREDDPTLAKQFTREQLKELLRDDLGE
ncbi:MAG: DEAD/DEAH box helicase [Acidobacteria bacterium]|nr:DEAD/DEAH box helicase [Acidobacteriota bacterium]